MYVQMVMLVKIEPEPDAAPQVFVTFAFKAGNQITFLLPVNIGAGSHCLAAGACEMPLRACRHL